MINKLVETYNVQYSFSSTNKSALWILGGLMAALVTTGIIIQKNQRADCGSAAKTKPFHPKTLPEITLDDVGGLQSEIKQEILQTLTTLKEPERSAKIGIKPPQGILLYGPPGTGKTLLAQAIAKELGANFFSTSGSAFNEMFVESVQPVSAAFSKMHVNNRQLSFSSMKWTHWLVKGNPMAGKKAKKR